MTGRRMTAWRMDYSAKGLFAAVVATVRNPRAGAEMVLAQGLPVPVIWTMLAAVVAVSALLEGFVLLLLTGGGDAAAAYFGDAVTLYLSLNPFMKFLLELALWALLALATCEIGRQMGGAGDFPGALALVTWLQVILTFLTLLQTLLLLVAPPVSVVLGFAKLALLLWLFTNFVAVLHGFQSLGKVFVMILLSGFAVLLVLSLAMAMLGVSVPTGTDGAM